MYDTFPLYKFILIKKRFFYIIRKPLLGGKYKESTLVSNNIYKINEIYSSGLLIGYSFDFFGKDTTYSKNFIGYGEEEDTDHKGRLTYINDYFFIMESMDAQRILIVGDYGNDEYTRR